MGPEEAGRTAPLGRSGQSFGAKLKVESEQGRPEVRRARIKGQEEEGLGKSAQVKVCLRLSPGARHAHVTEQNGPPVRRAEEAEFCVISRKTF